MNDRSLWRLLEKLQRWEDEARIRERKRTPKAERPRCGARCRDGHPCQARAVWDRERGEIRNARCRLHGGLSTGPKTPEGKLRSREGARRGGQISAERRRGRRLARSPSAAISAQDSRQMEMAQKTQENG